MITFAVEFVGVVLVAFHAHVSGESHVLCACKFFRMSAERVMLFSVVSAIPHRDRVTML